MTDVGGTPRPLHLYTSQDICLHVARSCGGSLQLIGTQTRVWEVILSIKITHESLMNRSVKTGNTKFGGKPNELIVRRIFPTSYSGAVPDDEDLERVYLNLRPDILGNVGIG